MDNKENISPEERLLKTIEDEEKNSTLKDGAVIDEEKQPGLDSKQSDESKNFFKQVAGSVKNFFIPKGSSPQDSPPIKVDGWLSFSGISFDFKEIDIKLINRILAMIFMFCLLFFIYSAQKNKKNISSVSRVIQNINYQVNSGTIELFKTPGFYLNEIAKRNIFREYQDVPVEKASEKKDNQSHRAQLNSIKEKFKIIGISWGENPRVMLQNKEDNKTYFVKENQKLGATPAAIKAITKKKVIIGIEEEEIDLE